MPALNFPANPINGQVYDTYTYDTGVGAWRSASTATAATLVSATAPTSTTSGDLWWNTNDGSFYVNYWDGSSYQWVEGRAPVTAQGAVSPNYIINSAFDFWQRGTSVTNNVGYLADRWYVTTNAVGTACNQSRVAGPSAAIRYALRVQQTASATSVVEYAARQSLEQGHIQDITGKLVTLSFWYRSNRTGTHGARIMGNVNNVGGTNFSTGFTVTTADTWQRYSITTDAFLYVSSWTSTPEMHGGYIDVGFKCSLGPGMPSLGANDYFEITGVQLETGSAATAFRRNAPSLQAEFDLCQRYFAVLETNRALVVNSYFSVDLSGGSQIATNSSFPVRMRRTPDNLTTAAGSVLLPYTYYPSNASSNGGFYLRASPTNNQAYMLSYSSSDNGGNLLAARFATGFNQGQIWVNAEL